ncbi:MAG TPA: glycosyltransferase family 9 protein [Bryobacteraceae bacterium]|nr:glycosyltransferase family 9 protein [Bryobacteraceae bacterium]
MRRLLVRPGAIGDCLTCFPAMDYLGAGYTEVWIPSALVPLVQFADRVRALPDTGLDLLGVAEGDPPAALREMLANFDSIVSWYGSNRPEFREAALRLNGNWRFFRALPGAGDAIHAIDFFARQAGAPMGLAPRIETPEGPVRDEVIIHPFSGSKRKNWPLDRFEELACRLKRPVAWTSGPEEELARARHFDDLLSLAEWIAGARLFIGNDSGITHLAAATGIPAIALFGASDPQVWAPRGENVAVIRGDSMDAIGVDEVLRAADRLLNASPTVDT